MDSEPATSADLRAGASASAPVRCRRARRHVHEFLGQYRGTLLSDGYEAYAACAAQRPGEVTHALCWAHTRRSPQARSVLDALDMAVGQRRPASVIHHSDQGCQYTSFAFGERCRQWGIAPSMGSVGDCYDNAMAESFFATLECELLDRTRFQDLCPSTKGDLRVLELPRFGGHLTIWEGGIHHAENKTAVPAGLPASDG